MMESLPLLPGYVFDDTDPTIKNFKVSQKLKFHNGYRVVRDRYYADDLSCDGKLVEYDPALTYGRGRMRKPERQRFVPRYVQFDRKTLSFEAYFKQGIFGSSDEYFRVRRVNLLYYLEDDTMALLEPRVDNAGFPQGKLVKRGKIPKPGPEGKYYHWTDLNVAVNIEIYGVVYRIVRSSLFTREFLTSQGIDVNEEEVLPPDPYIQERRLKEQMAHATATSTSHSLAEDKLFKFLEYDGMILTFEALWNEGLYKVLYFLADDTISVVVQKSKDTRGGALLSRSKVPKNWKDVPALYPGVYLEKTDLEVREFYAPKDLKVGETIFIFGRRFFLYDCDAFTRRYYADVLRMEQPGRIELADEAAEPCPAPAECKKALAESSRPAQDVIRKIYNFPKKLRYSLTMDAVHPEDEGREFILEYTLSHGTLRILEPERRNSGRFAGCFLGYIQVPKPDGKDCYSPVDFYIGGKINVFGHWFLITGTEPYVYKYMLANPGKFDEKLIKNVRDHLVGRGLIEDEGCAVVDEAIVKTPIEDPPAKNDVCCIEKKEVES